MGEKLKQIGSKKKFFEEFVEGFSEIKLSCLRVEISLGLELFLMGKLQWNLIKYRFKLDWIELWCLMQKLTLIIWRKNVELLMNIPEYLI